MVELSMGIFLWMCSLFLIVSILYMGWVWIVLDRIAYEAVICATTPINTHECETFYKRQLAALIPLHKNGNFINVAISRNQRNARAKAQADILFYHFKNLSLYREHQISLPLTVNAVWPSNGR